ncbi:putative quinol monooxygenase [Nocardioides sp. 1609]|uniref:putative quinol monooxygenase n=1 Tax=Nocardioides sp. 1609 TaxID=2508327 RepID=UPI00107034FB|nr:putative quinol monooxygenase [Nocardioides sp. 1609]
MTSSLRVVATVPIDPARAADAAPALAALAEASRGDAGCLAYDVYESAAVPGLFVTVEEWESQADLDLHMTQPHVATAFEVAGPLLQGEVAIHPLTSL